MFGKLISFVAKEQLQIAMAAGYRKAKQEQEDQRRKTQEFELAQYVGRKVVVLSNEWEDPIFGFGLRVEYITKSKSPILVIKNIFTDEELIVFGSVTLASEEMVYALLKLNPYERWNVKFPHAMISWDKPQLQNATPRGELYQRLIEVGFISQFVCK